MNRIARSGHAARLLVEEHRELGTLHLRFFDVVRVVEPDGEKLRRARDGRLELDAGQRNPVRRLPGRARGAIDRDLTLEQEPGHVARQLRFRRRQVNDRVLDDDANPRRAAMGEGREFHSTPAASILRFVSNYWLTPVSRRIIAGSSPFAASYRLSSDSGTPA